jgi:hypothetical protein
VAITVGYLLSPLLIALEWLINLVLRLFQPLAEQIGLTDLQLENLPTLGGTEAEEFTTINPPQIELPQQLLPILIMIFLILLVTLALSRIFSLMRHSATLETDSVHPFSNLGRPGLPGRGRRLLDQIGFFKRWRAATTVRYIYRQMSRSAAEAGFARAQSDTPYEYLPHLFEAWPDRKVEIQLITEAYTRVHYGEMPETQQELEQIQSAWAKIQETEPDKLAGLSTDIQSKSRPRR